MYLCGSVSLCNQIFACPSLLLTGFSLQVWALAVGKKTEMLATGGSDAVINLWYDCTADDKEEAFRKEVSCLTCLYPYLEKPFFPPKVVKNIIKEKESSNGRIS